MVALVALESEGGSDVSVWFSVLIRERLLDTSIMILTILVCMRQCS
jgi:hypothetical protein